MALCESGVAWFNPGVSILPRPARERLQGEHRRRPNAKLHRLRFRSGGGNPPRSLRAATLAATVSTTFEDRSRSLQASCACFLTFAIVSHDSTAGKREGSFVLIKVAIQSQ
ncbi:MAG: hypothetical protein MI923_10165 [Phycisphaerales bacterium]|nr:hypothetical protein [Phycisphaerales bacterium]